MHSTDQNTGMILMKKGNKTQDTGLWTEYKKVMCLFHDESKSRNGNFLNARF